MKDWSEYDPIERLIELQLNIYKVCFNSHFEHFKGKKDVGMLEELHRLWCGKKGILTQHSKAMYKEFFPELEEYLKYLQDKK